MHPTMQLFIGLSLTLALLTSPGYALNEIDPCTNPGGEAGRCINVRECDPIAKILRKGKGNLSTQEASFIRQSRCGVTASRNNLVCCKVVVDEGLPEPPSCGVDFSDRIVGGQKTKMDEFTWTALLHYRKPDGRTGYHCGASLINSRYVLTAAHCINAIPPGWSVIGVRLGEWDLSSELDCEDENDNTTCTAAPVDMGVEKIIVHEDYNPKSKEQYNDIALIRMSRNVYMSPYIAAICLPHKEPQRSRDHASTMGHAAGWGNTENHKASNVKLKVQLQVKDLRECAATYRTAGIALRETQLCAGGVEGKDTCSGDSGGPFTKMIGASNYLIGIVSFGPNKCGTPNVPGVYTNVAKFVDWIKKNVKP